MLTRLIDAKRGPVFVGYPTEWDGTIQIFLHGWDLDRHKGRWYVEDVVRGFPIEESWRESSSPSVLVVPATRRGRKDSVKWPRLNELIELAGDATSVHVIAHSGGYVNTLKWIDDHRIERISLLDALYGGVSEFRDWVTQSDGNRLDLACSRGTKTHKNCEKLVSGLSEYNLINSFESLNQNCSVNYIPIKTTHMSWVKSKKLLSKFF